MTKQNHLNSKHSSQKTSSLFAICLILIVSCLSVNIANAQVSLCTDHLKLDIDKTGSIASFYDLTNNTEYFAQSQPAYLLKIRLLDFSYQDPTSVTFSEDNHLLTFTYGEIGVTAKVKVSQKDTHVIFELVSIEPQDKVNRVVWGPYPTTIGQTVGETVAVVRDNNFAIGLQALNVKTDGKAANKDFGSILEGRCDNHALREIDTVMGHKNVEVLPQKDYTMVGSKIAIFGCPADKALDTIGKIEVTEGLPHPLLDGEWTKISPTATSAYMIIDFGEKDIDQCLEATKKAGLRYLYHGNPFETWGHFKIRRDHFPDGIESLKRCVKKANEMGIRLGGHTLSNFITPNDPYVRPIPDKRLAITGTSTLTGDIDEKTKEISVATAEPFNEKKRNWLHTVRIGDELIRYGSVSDEAPWKLLNCKRGAFGTTASSHTSGAEISKLMDHDYKIFLTNLDMLPEIAERLANLYNEADLKQISFDGLEGCYSSGHGDYARMLLVKDWYDDLKEKDVISDASNPGHFSWHIHTRMNWGEPWYDSFRESQQEYRLKNQKYFERNLMPRMLGWFHMKETTSLDDMEWMLARSAGFNAGYSLCASLPVLETNGASDDILAAIKNWERARHSKAFSCEQRKLMQDTKNEFHLEAIGEREWKLYPVHVSAAQKHSGRILQPGQPTYTEWDFSNPHDDQPLQFTLKVASKDADEKESVSNLTFELDNAHQLTINADLQKNQCLIYDGTCEAKVYDKHWNLVKTVTIEDETPQVSNGDHSIVFDADFSKGRSLQILVNFKTVGTPETVKGKINPPIIQ